MPLLPPQKLDLYGASKRLNRKARSNDQIKAVLDVAQDASSRPEV